MSTRRPRPQIKLTTMQAARIARVQPYVVRQWISRGLVKRTRAGYVDGESLADYLDRDRAIPARDGRGRYKRRDA